MPRIPRVSLLLLAVMASPAIAQAPLATVLPVLQATLPPTTLPPGRASQDTVIQKENVRLEYAQVLRAEPVFQTLRATSMVERCEQSTLVQAGEQRSGLSRVVGAVKDVLTSGRDAEAGSGDAADGGGDAAEDGCRMVPVEREFRRPIAFDVDYVHKGVKYRSRLPYDPGNRLRVRVSVTPVVTPASGR